MSKIVTSMEQYHGQDSMSTTTQVVEPTVMESGMPQTEKKPTPGGHQMSPNDPDNPMNWGLSKKLYTSLASTFLTFAYLFNLTSYSQARTGVMTEFNIGNTLAIAPFSVYLLGTAFAPVVTPHISERFGRRPVYFVAIFLNAIVTIGSSQAKSIGSLCGTRFIAGLLGGPIVVLIEGTYADIWPARKTLLYYSNLAWASYLGAACGPLVNGFIVNHNTWRWTQYTPLMACLLALLFAVGMPETYPREIIRRRAKKAGKPHYLAPAPSGTTLSQMAKLTVVNPLLMLVSDPITIIFTLQVTLAFGLVFQFFISVPTVLHLLYDFTPAQAGLAFTSAIAALPFAVVTCGAIEAFAFPRAAAKSGSMTNVDIEYRLLPAFAGGLLQMAALFWIANTAAPTFHPMVPIIGTWCFVWGNLVILISYISYIFDAYTPQGTLSALTIGAVLRILFAAATPLFIINMITKLGGNVCYDVWGGISAAFILLTGVLYFMGAKLRMTSRFNKTIKF